MKKLKAFTLIELLVALVVSGIVIGVAYQIYFIATKQFGEYKKANDKITNEVVLKGLLNMDFFNSTAIVRRSDNSIEVQKQDTLIQYTWNEKYILRINSAIKDTFFLNISSAELKFQNKEQRDGEMIDQLDLVSKERESERIFCFFKEYSADVLMRNASE